MIATCSCSNDTNDFIYLAEGFEQNPDKPRIGIELRQKDIFYCKEIVELRSPDSVYYKYYHARVDPEYFDFFKSEVMLNFKNVNESRKVVDDLEYSFIYNLEGDSDTVSFFSSFLSDDQQKLLDSLVGLERLAKNEILYHKFPDNFLMSKPLGPLFEDLGSAK